MNCTYCTTRANWNEWNFSFLTVLFFLFITFYFIPCYDVYLAKMQSYVWSFQTKAGEEKNNFILYFLEENR